MKIYYTKQIKKILKYYLVGLIAFLGNSFIMYFMSDLFGIFYGYSIFVIFLYNISIIFLLQKKFTFGANGNTRKQFYMFILYTISNLLISFAFIPLLKSYIGLNYTLTFIFISIIITIINFLIQNYLIFNQKHDI